MLYWLLCCCILIYNSILITTGFKLIFIVLFMLFLWVFGLSKVKKAHLLSRKKRLEYHEYYMKEEI